jgi:hypothetical protein
LKGRNFTVHVTVREEATIRLSGTVEGREVEIWGIINPHAVTEVTRDDAYFSAFVLHPKICVCNFISCRQHCGFCRLTRNIAETLHAYPGK